MIYEVTSELQDEIYSDDTWLRLAELDEIDVIIDEAPNAVWKNFHGKNRTSPEMIEIDNNKIELLKRICEAIDHAVSEIKNETNVIDKKIHN